ncbi:MAG: beta-mannosidase [Oscillospiraceae bacterium]|nr:beta-mannosidase [Oscillospiraceae bacterium]
MRFKKSIAIISALALSLSVFSGCSGGEDNAPSDDNNADANTAAAEETAAGEKSADDGINAVFGEIRTEFNENLDLSDYPLTPNDVPDGYEAVCEAETAALTGSCAAKDGGDMTSGGGYVDGLNQEGDSITFSVSCEYSGFYDLNFPTMGDPGRVNYVEADGERIGEITTTTKESFGDSMVMNVYLEKGDHEIKLLPYWGYVYVDCLKMTKSTAVTEDTYKVTKALSNPDADENTQRLYKFLCDIYGKYSLSGQYAEKGRESSEIQKLRAETGKDFAVLGLDVGNYSLGSKAHGTESRTVEYAYDWYKNGGGIVQLCWHWTTPEEYAKNDSENPWYSSFYKEGSNLDLDKIMNGEDEKAYQLLMDDIDNMAEQLKRLCDAGVPVLWRPLHEASGGWFWWGNCEAESYKKLWNVMYDKMTNEHGLTNLIWVWNGQSQDWYPGDETVDICGWDIYAGNRVYSAQSGRFADLANNYGEETKLVALTENGCVMDPDKVFEGNSRWLFWGTWSDPFTLKLGVVINEEYTEKTILNKAYNHERVLTLDELPDLQNYPLD